MKTCEDISVIILTRGRKYELRRALDSVYDQTVLPGEVIVIDSSEDDRIAKYVREYHYYKLIYYYNCNLKSVSDSRNKGIELAKKKYIAFLDSDDVWMNNRIELCLDAVRMDADIIVGQYVKHVRDEQEVLPLLEYFDEDNLIKSAFLQNFAVASATIYKHSFLVEIGGFPNGTNYTADWSCLIRAVKQSNSKICWVKSPLAHTWVMNDSVSLLEASRIERIEMFSNYEKELGICFDNDEIVRTFSEEKEKYIKNLLLRDEMIARKSSFYMLMSDWLRYKIDGGSLEQKLTENKISTLLIYGAGKHGGLVFDDLLDSSVKVIGWIDKKNMDNYFGCQVYKPGEKLPQCDAIIVSTFLEMDEIAKVLRKGTDAPILSIRDLIPRY